MNTREKEWDIQNVSKNVKILGINVTIYIYLF